MALETLTVAVGPDAESRTDELTSAILDIAVPTNATVLLLHVFSRKAYENGVSEAGYDPENPPAPDTIAARLESIHTITDRLEREGVDYRIRAEVGDVGDSIIGVVDETNTDMLLISGRRRSPTGKAVFGSTSHRLMMNAPCLVTFVREGIGRETRTE